MENMKDLFAGLGEMSVLVSVVMLSVLAAMAIDCVSGWRKAKLRGDEHTSYAFSRSLTKFLVYEGIVIIGGCMDVMIHFAWYQFMESAYMVPLVTIGMGIILCLVEAWSVKEKADKKQRKQIEAAIAVLVKALGKEAVQQTVMELLKGHAKVAMASQQADMDGEDVLRRTELVSDDF